MLLIEPQKLDQLSDDLRPLAADPPAGLLRRLKLLSDADRLLIDLALKHRLSRREIGLMLGITPGSVSRRFRRVIGRLSDPLVVALTDTSCTLPPDIRQVAVEHFLQRQHIQQIARKHGLARSKVVAMLQYVRVWHRGQSASR